MEQFDIGAQVFGQSTGGQLNTEIFLRSYYMNQRSRHNVFYDSYRLRELQILLQN